MKTNEPILWTEEDILAATGGKLLGKRGITSFDGVSIDSRNIAEKDLFVAIKGDRHDGHYFIKNAIAAGAQGILIRREMTGQLPVDEWISNGIWIAAVADTVPALGALAAFQRQRAGIPVVAITGSNGKTTTKELTAAVVGQRFNTLSTQGNLNNEIGLPLTLLKLSWAHEAAVVELGMNHPGEIRRLSRIAHPDVGVITTIGPAHLEGLGTVEDVMFAKGELRDHIKDGGWIVLNGDNPYCVKLGKTSRQKVLYFGMSENAPVRALDVVNSGAGCSFTLKLEDEEVQINLKLPGEFMVHNALASAAAGYLLKVPGQQIKMGIESVTPAKGRMAVIRTKRGITLIDDTYNANPGSMEAAIRTLVSLKGNHRGVLVAGDMLELGEHSASLHEDIGRLAAQLGVIQLFLTGKHVESLAEGARASGMPAGNIVAGDKKDIAEQLAAYLKADDWVLVKGSRSMGMEEIVQYLKDMLGV